MKRSIQIKVKHLFFQIERLNANHIKMQFHKLEIYFPLMPLYIYRFKKAFSFYIK